jgi:uncharacterized membrane protein
MKLILLIGLCLIVIPLAVLAMAADLLYVLLSVILVIGLVLFPRTLWRELIVKSWKEEESLLSRGFFVLEAVAFLVLGIAVVWEAVRAIVARF